MEFLLELQGLEHESSADRDISNMSNWTCWSKWSFWLC